MYCKKCGSKLSEKDKFCTKCGAPQNVTVSLMFETKTEDAIDSSVTKDDFHPKPNLDAIPVEKCQQPALTKATKKHTIGIIIGVILSIFIIIAVLLSVLFFSGSAYKVYNNLKDENYSEAVSIYETEVKDNYIQNMFANLLLRSYERKILSEFVLGNIEIEEVDKIFETLYQIGFEDLKEVYDEELLYNQSDIYNEQNTSAYTNGNESTQPTNNSSDSTETVTEGKPNSGNSSTSSDSNHEASNNTVNNNVPTKETSTTANVTSLSNSQAVALFNKASANAKNKLGKRYTAVDLVQLPGGDFLKTAVSSLLPNPNDAVSVTGVPNSSLQVSDFSSITSKKSGNNWVLTMNLKTETHPNISSNARAFAELPQDEIDASLDSLKVTPSEGIKFVYSGGTIVATVSADGSKLINATYTMKVNMIATNVKALGVISVSSAKVTITQTDKF